MAFPPGIDGSGATPRGRGRVCENNLDPEPAPGPRTRGSLPSASVPPSAAPAAAQRRAQLQAATKDSRPCLCESQPGQCVHRPPMCLAHPGPALDARGSASRRGHSRLPDGSRPLCRFPDNVRVGGVVRMLRSLKAQGLGVPKLLVADCNLGIWAGTRQAWPEAAEQRCRNRKIANVLDRLLKRERKEAKTPLRAGAYAATRAGGQIGPRGLRGPHGGRDLGGPTWDRITAFSAFARSAGGTGTTNGGSQLCGCAPRPATRFKKVDGASALIWKLLRATKLRFHKLNAPHLLPAVLRGERYEDGQPVPAPAAARTLSRRAPSASPGRGAQAGPGTPPGPLRPAPTPRRIHPLPTCVVAAPKRSEYAYPTYAQRHRGESRPPKSTHFSPQPRSREERPFMLGFGRRRTRQRALALMDPLRDEFARALREETESNSTADENVRIVRAAIRVAESALDDAVPILQLARSTSKPLVIGDFFEEFQRRAAATARCSAAMNAVREIAQNVGLSDRLSRLLAEVLEEAMLHAAHEDAKADDSNRPFAHRLLMAAQARAVSFQEVVKSAQSPESTVPVVPAAARANAAINVARRLEDNILGPTSDD